MYCLYELHQDGEVICYGEYGTLAQCERATELRWEIMQRLGYNQAQFYCTKVGRDEKRVCWIY